MISGAYLIVDDSRAKTKLVSAIRVTASRRLKEKRLDERLRTAVRTSLVYRLLTDHYRS